MNKPVIMAGEEVRRADNVLVRIETGDGMIGWGEAASAPTMTGETLASMVAAVQHLAPALLGRDAADHRRRACGDGRPLYGNHGAKAAIEIALLRSCRPRQPASRCMRLLGEKKRAAHGAARRDRRRRSTTAIWPMPRRKRPTAITAFKIKVGIDTPDEGRRAHARHLQGARRRPADFLRRQPGLRRRRRRMRLCARGGRAPGSISSSSRSTAHDLDGMAKVAPAANGIAIGADEGIHSLDDIARHHELKAARGVSLKAIKLGGLRGVVAGGALCERLGMNVNLACKTGESSIACAALLHAAAVIAGYRLGADADRRRPARGCDRAFDHRRARFC